MPSLTKSCKHIAITGNRAPHRAPRGLRSSCGQGIIEGVIGLILVMGGAVLGTLLLLNSGSAMYLKEKLAIVTAQSAKYAAGLSPTSDVTGSTTQFVRDLLPQFGLTPSSDLTVQTSETTISGSPAVQVSVTTGIPLFGNGTVFPLSVKLTDSSACLLSSASNTGGSGEVDGYLAVLGNEPGNPGGPISNAAYIAGYIPWRGNPPSAVNVGPGGNGAEAPAGAIQIGGVAQGGSTNPQGYGPTTVNGMPVIGQASANLVLPYWNSIPVGSSN
jgi:hypothetical protein